MLNFWFVFILFLFSQVVTGQEILEKPPTDSREISKWFSDGFSYVHFGTQEQHSYFSVIYKMNPKLQVELQAFYDTYRTSDVFDMSTRVKWYPTERAYLFSGVGVQVVRTKGFGGEPTMPVRMLNGVGYEPSKHVSIEAVHDLNFSKNEAGLNASSNLFTLKGKYRF